MCQNPTANRFLPPGMFKTKDMYMKLAASPNWRCSFHSATHTTPNGLYPLSADGAAHRALASGSSHLQVGGLAGLTGHAGGHALDSGPHTTGAALEGLATNTVPHALAGARRSGSVTTARAAAGAGSRSRRLASTGAGASTRTRIGRSSRGGRGHGRGRRGHAGAHSGGR